MEPLTVRDISNLRVEAHGFPMHVAALLLLDGGSLLTPEGTFRLAEVSAELERRTHATPRLRQVLRRVPDGSGSVVLVDDDRFDIARHVRVAAVPSPADERAMLETCARLNQPRLDRSRPLWEIWFLTGLPASRVAMLIRLHHVIADGLAAVALLGALFGADEEPVPTPPTVAAGEDRMPRPSLGDALGAVRRFLGDGLAPRTSLNAPLGGERRVHLARANLERAREVAHEHDGTVNDVMLAAVTAGARALLRSRGELRPGLELKASVPVSRRTAAAPRVGNDVGVMIVPLPVALDGSGDRLDRIVAATGSRKRDPRTAVGWDVGSALMQRAVVAMMRHQRFINLLLSNVPGPTRPLRVAGAPVLEAFQIAPIQGNVTIGVGALSYAGQLNLDVVTDTRACPDAPVFADGLAQELDALGIAR